MTIDVRKGQVSTYATLDLPRNETLQCFDVLPDGSIIASQGIEVKGRDRETTVFSRHHQGRRVGEMECVDAGHGTVFGWLPEESRLIFDWAGQLVLAPFKPGKFTRSQVARPVATKLQPGFTSVSVADAGNVVFRQRAGDDQTWILRRWSDAKANVDKPLAKHGPMPTAKPLMQGGTAHGTDLYYVSGRRASDQLLSVYDMRSGRLRYEYEIPYGEPEGIVVRDRAVLIGFTSGSRGAYRHTIRRFVPPTAGSYPKPDNSYVYVEKLRAGQRNSDSVWWAQTALRKLGHTVALTGAYDTATRAAMEKYQRSLGDSGPYGEPGPLQTARLFRDAQITVTVRNAVG